MLRSSGFERYLLDQVQAAVIATDATGAITHWNRGAEVIFGWGQEAALGRDFRELFVAPEDLGRASDIHAAVLSGEAREGEFPVRRKDGGPVLLYTTHSPIHGSTGAVEGVVSVSVDITERVRRERLVAARTAVTQALAEAPSLLEGAPAILEAICRNLGWEVGALWRVDQVKGVIRCFEVWHAPEARVREFEGATRASDFPRGVGLPGRVWSTARSAWIPDVTMDENFPRANVAVQEGIHGAFGFPILLGSEVLGALEFFSREIKEPDADLLLALSVIGSQIGQFIERKEAERAVQESEARKSALVQAALDCIITMDHEGKILEFNPAAERTFGFSRDDAIGRELAELIIPPALRERHREGLDRFLATGEGPMVGRRMELSGMRADGTEFPVELTVAAVDLPGPPMFTGFVRDITLRRAAEIGLRESRERLRLALEAGLLGTWHHDIETGSVTWDETLERIFGMTPGTFGGTFEDYRERLHPDERGLIAERIEEARQTGSDFKLEHRVILPDGTIRWIEGRGLCITDESGKVVAMTGVVADITERKRVDDAQQFLAEAGPLLAASIEGYEETLTGVANLVVPQLADWCTIDVLDPDGAIEQVAVAHVDTQKVKLVREFRELYPPNPRAPTGVPKVLRTGEPEMFAEIPEALLVESAPNQEFLDIILGLGLRSAMIVPMVARGRTLGAITLVTAESGRRYDQTDLVLAQEIARRAALALDNARLLREIRTVATRLQESLLPPELPDIPGLDVVGRYRWGGEGNEVGGDFYDVFDTGDGSWALIIGDVCGKGVEAAIVTSLARHTLRAVALQERKPSSVLRNLNEAVMRQRSDHMFCTVSYIRLKPHDGGARLTVCCAGHPLPLVLRADGSIESAGVPGTLLGIFGDPELTDAALDIGRGDAVVLLTDGILEARRPDGRIFGRDGLVSVLQGCRGGDASRIADAIVRTVSEFTPDHPRDDVALLVLKVKGG